MKTAIKVICGFLAALVFSAGISYIAMSFDVNEVSGFKVEKRTQTTQMLKWNKISNVSGYNIYQKNAKSNEYTLIKKVDNGSISNCEIKGLDMETFYTFKIACFKTIFGYEKEGILSEKLLSCTLPRNQNIKQISEENEKSLTPVWSAAVNCNGYELQYSLDKEFADAQTIDISNKAKSSYDISGLTESKTYNFRLRSYILLNGEKIYSEWSQVKSATVTPATDMNAVDPNKPMVALTFDDGPDYASSSNRILDVIEKYKVTATFFTVGENAKNNPKNMKRKVALGCEIGNHTYDHNHYGSGVTAADIYKCSDAIESVCGERPTVFRSTGGLTTSVIRNECKKEGMSLFYWTVDTEDWKYRNAKKAYKAAMTAKDGDIILMHDIYSTTADAVEKAIPALIKKGYQLVTVSQLIEAKTGKKPQTGTQYISANQTN